MCPVVYIVAPRQAGLRSTGTPACAVFAAVNKSAQAGVPVLLKPRQPKRRIIAMAESSASNNPRDSGKSSGEMLDGPRYLASLRDAREVYIYGERVQDVTAHPAFPEFLPVHRAPVRRAVRPKAARRSNRARPLRRPHPQIFQALLLRAGTNGSARSHRRLVAHELRLHGTHAGLQGGAHGQPRVGARVLRAVRRKRTQMVRALFVAMPLSESLPHQSAHRPQPPRARSRRRLRACSEGTRRRHGRQRRQDARRPARP